MTSNRKKVAGIAGAALCCCIAFFVFFAIYVIRHPDDPPEASPDWLGIICGITAIVGMISTGVLVTTLAFGFLRKPNETSEMANKALQPETPKP